MPDVHLAQVLRICEEALAREGAERAAYLSAACQTDDSLRAEVEQLLAQLATSDGFLDTPPWSQAAPVLTSGQRLGPYEIASAIGAGGMGQVYAARDTRLDRVVAIKVLPPALSADPARRGRFEREAKAIAGLTHPGICTLYDVGDHDGAMFLVMERLEGQTLAARLEKGPLPVDQALAIATEVAEALSAAHRHGVIHRDLKPANVMLTKSGEVRHGSPQAKLLDFGLAKLTGRGEEAAARFGGAAPASPAATLTRRGSIVGTLHYMAPEQIEGKEADARTDIFSFGAVVYEMLTGKRPFEGASSASAMAAILERDPAPPSSLQPSTPPAIDRLVRQCLAKNPDDRPDTAHDVASQLRNIQSLEAEARGRATSGARSASSRRRWYAWSLAVAVAITAVGTGVAMWRLASARMAQPIHLHADMRPADILRRAGAGTPSAWSEVAVTPDERTVIFSGQTTSGARAGTAQLYSLSFDPPNQDEAVPIAGTECTGKTGCPHAPFLSPDGAWIAFWEGGRTLKRVPYGGGKAVEICSVLPPLRGGLGGTWTKDNQIVFAVQNAGLMQAPAFGPPGMRPLTTLNLAEGELRHTNPYALPNGGVLYSAAFSYGKDDWNVMVHTQAGEQKVLAAAADARYLPSGHLLFARAGKLRLVPFDLSTLRTHGVEVGVADDVLQALSTPAESSETAAAQFAAVGPRLLVVVPGGVPESTSSLAWIDRRTGSTTTIDVPQRWGYGEIRLSPDGGRLAAECSDGSIAVFDLQAGRMWHVADGMSAGSPLWTPDGKELVFMGNKRGRPNLFIAPAAGGEPRRLTTSQFRQETRSLAGRGREVVFMQSDPLGEVRLAVFTVPLDGSSAPRPFTMSAVPWAEESPDGRWLLFRKMGDTPATNAFQSPDLWWQRNESGSEPKLLAGRYGLTGNRPVVWRADARELFFLVRRTCEMFALRVTPAGPAERPERLFALDKAKYCDQGGSFDVTPDGARFIFARPEGEPAPPATRMNVSINWFDELKAKAPAR